MTNRDLLLEFIEWLANNPLYAEEALEDPLAAGEDAVDAFMAANGVSED